MNKLLDKSANRLIGEEFILDMEQYRLEIIGGAWENVSYDEKRFISHVLKIEDVREICLVREMGFADVWIVFSELSCERELEIIAYCNEFLDGRAENDPQAPKIDFLVLTPENFTGDVPFPSIHIRRGGAGDAD
ncbi:MAG: hypothetical protein FWH06_03740 [Oscillospiraceae bacterium]|nr:hypothetical protein [Oscillospiraceae bacterium]